jgi:hypothetical protein
MPETETPTITPPADAVPHTQVETCEYCGSPALAWRKCKQICTACGQINRSCADL